MRVHSEHKYPSLMYTVQAVDDVKGGQEEITGIDREGVGLWLPGKDFVQRAGAEMRRRINKRP